MAIWILAGACLALTALSISLLLRSRGRTAAPDPEPVASRIERDPLAPLERMDVGVVVLNTSLAPVYANRAARRLLRLPQDSLPVRLQSDELLSVARRAVRTNEPAETELTLWPERGRVRARAVTAGAEDVTLYLDDVTEETRAHQIRRQFVVNASHELKTPVAGIQALAETVTRAIDDDPAAAKRFTRKLLIESERLARLVQDLLDLSRLEDPAHYSNASVDVGAVTEREVESLRPQADDKRVALLVEVAPSLVIRGDEQQLGLLVRNLVDNAIRYTPAEGRISVTVRREDADAVVEVADDGAGIPLNAQSRVFERFFRVDEDRSRGSGGTGLGLSIVKHVAEMHGGHVALRSELGEGSTFTVRLPLGNGSA